MKKPNQQSTEPPHIGTILKAHFKTNRTHQAALSRALAISEHTVIKYKSADSIHTRVLWQLCHALKHNLFMDIALSLPQHYATNQDIHQTNLDQIETLKRRIEILEAEKAVLLEVKR